MIALCEVAIDEHGKDVREKQRLEPRSYCPGLDLLPVSLTSGCSPATSGSPETRPSLREPNVLSSAIDKFSPRRGSLLQFTDGCVWHQVAPTDLSDFSDRTGLGAFPERRSPGGTPRDLVRCSAVSGSSTCIDPLCCYVAA